MLLTSLILAGAVQGLFLILLLKTKKENSSSDKLLMIWLAITAVQLLFYYDNLSLHPVAPIYFQLLGFSMPLISAPTLYLYTYSLSFGGKLEWIKHGGHLLPYVLFNMLLFYFVNMGGITISNALPRFSNEVPAVVKAILTVPLAVVSGYYAVLGLQVLLKYQRLLPESYSYTEKINLNWLKGIVISLLVLFIVLFVIIKYSVSYGLLTYENLFAVVGSILAFYVFFIGYFGLRQTTIFTNIPVTPNVVEEVPAPANYKNSGLSDEMAAQLFQQLKHHMAEKKPFLDEDLNLTMLAQQLDITPNQLSQVINQQSASNFFNFVNSYRVEVVRERLKDPAYAHYSILNIGYDCGFRSKSSFNKIFKEMVGKTPSEYQKS
jgi:AraC-like DNA-binding protein